MRRLVVLLALGGLFVASPAFANLHGRKHSVDSRLSTVQARIAAAQKKEAALEASIATTTARIRVLEAKVGDVSTKLGALQEDLALRQKRLDAIDALYRAQTERLAFLRTQQKVAQRRLASRVVELYEQGDASGIDVILGARSLQDAISRVEFFQAVAEGDRRIINDVSASRARVTVTRARTRRLRATVQSQARIVAYRVAQEAAARDALVGARNSLSEARTSSAGDLASVKESEQNWRREAESLKSESASLAARIQAAQAAAAARAGSAPHSSGTSPSTPPPAPSSSGLIWPVNGTITSPFGMRWGSLHPGLDIAAPSGTPIRAAAAGRVLVAGYNGGYGNLVVLDNGGNLSTAYAHQLSVAVAVGQDVAQGQVIGYVGSTGFSTGPHVHFEVRVNATPVDPLGYL